MKERKKCKHLNVSQQTKAFQFEPVKLARRKEKDKSIKQAEEQEEGKELTARKRLERGKKRLEKLKCRICIFAQLPFSLLTHSCARFSHSLSLVDLKMANYLLVLHITSPLFLSIATKISNFSIDGKLCKRCTINVQLRFLCTFYCY